MGYRESCIDKDIEIWRINDVEVWVGFSITDIKNEVLKQYGEPIDQILENPNKIPRSEWDKTYIIDPDDPYEPRYTYSNMLMKLIIENQKLPFLLSTTEY